MCLHAKLLQSCMTLWTIACQAPLSTGISRQEYWNRLFIAKYLFYNYIIASIRKSNMGHWRNLWRNNKVINESLFLYQFSTATITWHDKPPQAQWLKTICIKKKKKSMCFVCKSLGQWLRWLRWAWLDSSGLGSPSCCWWAWHQPWQLRWSGFPPPVCLIFQEARRGTFSRQFQKSQGKQKHTKAFPASACAISADSSLTNTSSKFHSDPKGQGSRLHCISKESCKVIWPNASQGRRLKNKNLKYTHYTTSLIFKGQQQ